MSMMTTKKDIDYIKDMVENLSRKEGQKVDDQLQENEAD